jgi:phosphatidylserine/phosphatidylglycerophosphate/cardiolipin synthase-like enzyme
MLGSGVTVELLAKPPTVTISKQNIQFLRGQNYLDHLSKSFWSADKRILIASMVFSDRRSRAMTQLYSILSQRAKNGVTVKVIMAGKYNFGRFNQRPMKLFYDKTNMESRAYVGEGLMHSKFIVIDNEAVYNGSANFTASGIGRTEETTVYLKNTKLAETFAKYFDDLWYESIGYYSLKDRLGL